MAGNNPVFRGIEKDIKSGEAYAGFGPAPTNQASAAAAGTAGMTAQQLEQMYGAPSATPVQAGRVTFDDVIMKTLGLFVLLVAVAAATWVYSSVNPERAMILWWVGMLGGLALGLVIAFRKKISVPLIVGYAALEGVFVGAISQVMNEVYPGIVGTAVLATACTFGAVFVGYRFNFVRVTSRSRRIFGYALMGYLLFGVVNLISLLFGWTSGWGIGNNSGLGLIISVIGVAFAAYSLAIDFDAIEQGVRAQLPQKYSWLLAHGLIVSLVWLYIEMLRLLARLRQ